MTSQNSISYAYKKFDRLLLPKKKKKCTEKKHIIVDPKVSSLRSEFLRFFRFLSLSPLRIKKILKASFNQTMFFENRHGSVSRKYLRRAIKKS